MLVQKGTRVVLRVAIPAATGVLPSGSVAEIVEVPVDPLHAYRVRFVNGHEASVQRTEFALLSEVKSEDLSQLPPTLTEHGLREHVIYQCVVGSRAYGLDTPDSDTDRRGIYQAPTTLVLSLYDPPQQLEDDDAQECFWELKKFLILALKANPNVLEVLYSPLVEVAKRAAKELLAIRSAFLSRLVYQTFNGYVLSQFKKMMRSKETRREPNWRHAMHLIRLLESGIVILETGELRLRAEHREELLQIRQGAWPWDRVDRWRRELHERFERAFATTNLPERPDYGVVNDYLIRARRGEFVSAS